MKIDPQKIYIGMQAAFMIFNSATPTETFIQKAETNELNVSMSSVIEDAQVEECTLMQDIEEQFEITVQETNETSEEPYENVDEMWDLSMDGMDAMDALKEEEKRRRDEEIELASDQENSYGY